MQMSRNNMSNYINSVQLKIDIPLHGSSLKEILDLFWLSCNNFLQIIPISVMYTFPAYNTKLKANEINAMLL